MRRVTLTAIFFLAACGGGVRNPEAVERSSNMRDAQTFLLTAEAQAAIAQFAKVHSQSELDTCLAAYVDDFGGPTGLSEPVQKPDVKGLQNFLAQCLDGSVPVDVRTVGNTDKVRATGTGAGYIRKAADRDPAMRTQSDHGLRAEGNL